MRKIYVEMTEEEYKLYQDGISKETALQIVLDNLKLANASNSYNTLTMTETQNYKYEGVIDNKDIEIYIRQKAK